jgi:hypothetical protein
VVSPVAGGYRSRQQNVKRKLRFYGFYFVRLHFFPLLGLVAVFLDCSRTFYQLRCGRVFTSSMACIKSWQNSSKINLLMFCCLQLLLFFTLAHHYPNDFFGD